jgi:methylated-DNA-[protein]-cysteine S-methyltransferase
VSLGATLCIVLAASATRGPHPSAGGRKADNPTMDAAGLCLFDTALGVCGIAWDAQGVRALQLPEADAARTLARLRRRTAGLHETAPPPEAQRAIAGVVALLRGEDVDLSEVRLDQRGVPGFHRRVYALARAIPRGTTLSYGELAERLGDRRLARAVGQALARNPFAPIVPCHRVVAAHGKAGGFSAPGGLRTKWRLLQIEDARPTVPDLFDPDLTPQT